jgi:hypothetical protein
MRKNTIMKNKITFLVICLFLKTRLHAQVHQTGYLSIDAFSLGAWAYEQHNNISLIIHPAILNGRIQVFINGKPPEDKKAFLRTNFNSYYDPDEHLGPEYYISYILTSKDTLTIQGRTSGICMQFLKKEFYALLNNEQIQYLKCFAYKNTVYSDSVYKKSQSLIKQINYKIFKETMKPSTQLFRTPDLQYPFKNEEKKYCVELVSFIPMDHDDPTIGRDTVISIDPSSDSTFWGSTFYALNVDHLTISIQSVSRGYHPIIKDTLSKKRWKYADEPTPTGYISYKQTLFAIPEEYLMMEYCLAYCITTKLGGSNYNSYSFRQRFGLWDKK